MLLVAAGASAQVQTVKGKVADKTGMPVAGASVIIKGTTRGTTTDSEGRFTLGAAPADVLSVNFIGYKTVETVVGQQTQIDITLVEDAQIVDEVVVVGFGTQKKVNLTGAVGIATAKDLEQRPVTNAVMALQGVVPGLNISNKGVGGELNAAKSIDIRGTATIGQGSSGAPLILIDGMEGDLTNLNPQDIESISVLKDAASSSIYGSRAPFGVILVTTKSGHEGRTQVNYNNSFRFSTPVMLPELADSWEFVNFFRDAKLNGGQDAGNFNNPSYLQKVRDYRDGKLAANDVVWSADGTGYNGNKWNYDWTNANVDWLDEYYKDTSFAQEHNISVSGGSDKIDYYASANYLGQDGFMRYGTDTYDRFAATGKFNAKLAKWITLGYTSRFTRTDYARPTSMKEGFYNDILRRARPTRPVRDPNGYLMSDLNYVAALQDGGRHKEQTDVLAQQFKLTITPLKGWTINADFNTKISNYWIHEDEIPVYSHYAVPTESTGPTYIAGSTSATQSNVAETAKKETYLNPNVYTSYNRSLGGHNLGVMLGFQAESFKYRDLNANRKDMVVNSQPALDLTTSTTAYGLGGKYDNWATAGFFGRINYDYDGRYLLEANLRYDGTSRFRRGSRWVWTPSVSVGWNIARERFMESVTAVDLLKIRVSYGVLANQNTDSYYPTYQNMSVGAQNGNWLVNGAKPNTTLVPGLVALGLTWEKVATTNVGLDWGLLNNRLTGSFDYFIRDTKDMVGPSSDMPAVLGTAVPKSNNTELRTQGWELSVAWRDKVKDFSYGVRVSLSDSHTKITKYFNATGDLGNNDKYQEGQWLGEIWGYQTVGIAKTQAEMDAHLASLPEGGQTALGSNWGAGDIMYADLNHDGKISKLDNTLSNHGDLKVIGNKTPRYRMGVNIDLGWKGIDVQMFWQGVLKQDYVPGTKNLVFWGTNSSGEYWSTALKPHLDYFRAEDTSSNLGPNTDAYYPRPLFSDKNQQPQSRYVQNAAYMRLKNLQIGYTLPQKWTQKAGISKLRVYFSGENLWTITNLTDVMDPETVGIGKQGGTVYPLATVYSFGLNVNF